MMLRDTGPVFTASDKVPALENQVHSRFCPMKAQHRAHDAVSLRKYTENES